MQRDFLLDLSTGFVYDCLDGGPAARPGRAPPRVLEHFSGTLCIDELHLGKITLAVGHRPAPGPVAFALVASNDQDHMRRFLGNLNTGA